MNGDTQMKIRTLVMGAVTALLFAVPTIAEAAWGVTTGTANVRTGPSTGYAKITTLPGGAQVWVDGQQNGWYHISYNGRAGFVSSSLVDTQLAMAPSRDRPFYRNRGMAPRFGYMKKPWWDNQNQAWYDGRRWYRNGVWYNSPQGFTFGFNFGG
jgi:uncharacterized protein YraI